MALKEIKVGRVTWVDSAKGAFIEDLSEEETMQQAKQSFSPGSQVFVPSEMMKGVALKEGQMVQYEEEDNVAVRVKPLA
jgi:hypothetical protein